MYFDPPRSHSDIFRLTLPFFSLPSDFRLRTSYLPPISPCLPLFRLALYTPRLTFLIPQTPPFQLAITRTFLFWLVSSSPVYTTFPFVLGFGRSDRTPSLSTLVDGLGRRRLFLSRPFLLFLFNFLFFLARLGSRTPSDTYCEITQRSCSDLDRTKT